MNSVQTIRRADIIRRETLFSGKRNEDDQKFSGASRWSTHASTLLIGRKKAKWMERIMFMIEGFDKKLDYYVDFGDGNCKRVICRKFHYQYSSSGNFEVSLYMKAGDNMIPVCTHQLEVEHSSLIATLRSISLF